MKTFKELREALEGYVSAAQRKAVWASRADGGKGHPDNKKAKKEDAATDKAVKDFLAKGGKIKKLAPGKAAGYHGKDDPGKGMAGMMDKGDTKAIGTRKKVKSMENYQVQKYTDGKKDGAPKSFGGNLKKATTHASMMRKKTGGNYQVHKENVDEANIKELSHDTMNKYHDAAQKSKDRATNSAVANILRKTDHSKDLKTRAKRIKGMELAKTRSIKKIRGDK